MQHVGLLDLERLVHLQNIASKSFIQILFVLFGRCSSALTKVIPLGNPCEMSTHYSNDLHIFSFPTQLDSILLCQENALL